MRLALSILILCAAASHAAQVVIGGEAALALPSSALYANWTPFIPANGAVEGTNAPVLTWPYRPPHTTTNVLSPPIVYRHRLQTSTNNFTSTNLNIVVSNNFYNFLAPFANITGTQYWRVVWLNSNATVNVHTSDVHHFTFVASPFVWDRSPLADWNYVTNICGRHPHMGFVAASVMAVSNHLETADASVNWSKSALLSAANNSTNQVWWHKDRIHTNFIAAGQTASVSIAWSYLRDVIFAYRITGNPNYLGTGDTHVDAIANALALKTVEYGMDHMSDAYTMGSFGRSMARVYSWGREYFGATTRTNIRYAGLLYSKFLFYQFSSVYHQPDATKVANRTFDGTEVAQDYSQFMNGDGHGRVNNAELFDMAVAFIAEDPEFWPMYETSLNYLIGKYDPLRTDEGAYYGWGIVRGYIHYGYPTALVVFPDAGLTNITTLAEFIRLAIYKYPMGYRQRLNPLGDLADNATDRPFSFNETTYAVAWIRSDGALYRHQQRSKNWSLGADVTAAEGLAFLKYHYPRSAPTETDYPSGYVNPNIGIAMAYDQSVNNLGIFTNGVGVILASRTAFNTVGHATYYDLSPVEYAWGAHLNAEGVENYMKHPLFNRGPFVSGVGVYHIHQSYNGIYPYNGRLLAYSNSADIAYIAAEGVHMFNRSGRNVSPELGSGYYNANEQSDMRRAEHHTAWPKKKFWIHRRVLEGTNTHQFQAKHNILENTLAVTGVGQFSYSATNFYNGLSVTNHVSHCCTATLTQLIQTNTGAVNIYRTNPFTAEDYTASFPDSYPTMKYVLWLYNGTPSTNRVFDWVEYPVKWGGTAPTIVWKDQDTVAVTNLTDSVEVLFSWNTNNVTGGAGTYASTATHIIDPQGALITNSDPPAATPIERARLNGGVQIIGGVTL